jgi:hypothetical protein
MHDWADRLQALENSNTELATAKRRIDHDHQADNDLCWLWNIDFDIKVQQVIRRLRLTFVGCQMSNTLDTGAANKLATQCQLSLNQNHNSTTTTMIDH